MSNVDETNTLDRPTDEVVLEPLRFGRVVHIEGQDGFHARGIVQLADEGGLVIKLYAGHGGAAALPAGAMVQLLSYIPEGASVTDMPVLRYERGARLLHVGTSSDKPRVERRRFLRVPVRVAVDVLSVRPLSLSTGTTVDLSTGGAALEMPESALRVGDRVKMCIQIDDGSLVRVTASVVGFDTCYRLKFLHMKPRAEERLIRFLVRRESEERRNRTRN